MAKSSEPQLGFTLWVLIRPGLSPSDEAAFARRLEDYLADHNLLSNGTPLCSVVWSPERSLSPTDQVDLITWLGDDMAPVTVLLSPLSERIDRPATRDAGCIRAEGADLTLIPLTWLYRCRRITAELYLQILGGFVRPAVVH